MRTKSDAWVEADAVEAAEVSCWRLAEGGGWARPARVPSSSSSMTMTSWRSPTPDQTAVIGHPTRPHLDPLQHPLFSFHLSLLLILFPVPPPRSNRPHTVSSESTRHATTTPKQVARHRLPARFTDPDRCPPLSSRPDAHPAPTPPQPPPAPRPISWHLSLGLFGSSSPIRFAAFSSPLSAGSLSLPHTLQLAALLLPRPPWRPSTNTPPSRSGTAAARRRLPTRMPRTPPSAARGA